MGREVETAVVDSITDRLCSREQGTGTEGSAHGIHLRVARNITARMSVFPSRTFTFCGQLGTANRSGFHEQVTDKGLSGPNVPHNMNTLTRCLTNSGCVAQALSSLNHSSTVSQTIKSAMSHQLQSDLGVAGTSDPLQHRPPLPKLDILAVDALEESPEEWEAEDDVKGGPLDPREVKTDREKEIKYVWDMEVYEDSTEAEARARTGRSPVGLKWIDTNKGSAEAPRYRSRLVCTEVRHKGVEPIFSATPSAGNSCES